MIIRIITYHAIEGKDAEGWMRDVVSDLRGVKGMRHAEFIRSQNDPSQYGAIMLFNSKEDLDNYKETGPYKSLVQGVRENWLDESKPVGEQIFEVVDS